MRVNENKDNISKLGNQQKEAEKEFKEFKDKTKEKFDKLKDDFEDEIKDTVKKYTKKDDHEDLASRVSELEKRPGSGVSSDSDTTLILLYATLGIAVVSVLVAIIGLVIAVNARKRANQNHVLAQPLNG